MQRVSLSSEAPQLGLVRSMRYLGLLATLLSLTACGTYFVDALTYLSPADRHELDALASARLGHHANQMVYIESARPDHVVVETCQGVAFGLGAYLQPAFSASKRHGHWTIDRELTQ